MSAKATLAARVEQYLAERRRLGLRLRTMSYSLHSLVEHVRRTGHRGALTFEVMGAWARQARQGHGIHVTLARRLRRLRPFTRWLQQFEPATEVPDEAIFGPIPGRQAPHIYRDEELVAPLGAADHLGPRSSPRAAVMLVQTFFAEHLQQQRAMSPRTVAAYRDAFVLFLDFAKSHLRKQPTAIRLREITPTLILAFLDHLEHERGNTVRSRNARLAALRAFLKFAGRRDLDALHVVEQALDVPMKRFERPMVGFLSREEMLAIIGEPGSGWTSQRDHLLLRMLYNTGARVSEIVAVKVADVVLDGAACVHLHGKGRKQRAVPLWSSTVRQIKGWLKFNPQLGPSSPLLLRRWPAGSHPKVGTRTLALVGKAPDRAIATPCAA